jgi:uncharacterized protein (DUF983 family)
MTRAKTGGTAPPLRVTRWQIVQRGLLHRCPNCGGDTVFRGLFKTNARCERCGFLVEREEGFFIGAMAINYAIAALPLIVVFVLVFMNRIGVPLAIGIVIGWGTIVPILFYRSSKSLWMALVYFFDPRALPANQAGDNRPDASAS